MTLFPLYVEWLSRSIVLRVLNWIQAEDVINFLATRCGDYAVGCSMDFSKPPKHYDTFALRDLDGFESVSSIFLYFRNKAAGTEWLVQSFISHSSHNSPFPHACILLTILRLFFYFIFFKLTSQLVAFDAAPFYSNEPLRFRGIADSLAAYHIKASECCLIHPHVGSLVESSSIQKSAWVTRQTLTFPLHRIDLIPGLRSVSTSQAYGTMAFSPLADAIVS